MPALRILVIGNHILGDNKIAQELALRLPKDSQLEFSSGAAEAIEKVRLFKPNAIVLNFSMALSRIDGEMLISTLAKQMQLPVIAFGRVASSQQTAQRMGALKYVVKSSDPLLADHFYHLLADDLQALKNAPASATGRITLPSTSAPSNSKSLFPKRDTATSITSGTTAAPANPLTGRPTLGRPSGLPSFAQRTAASKPGPASAAPAAMPPPRSSGPIELIAIGRRHGGSFRGAPRPQAPPAGHCHCPAYPSHVLQTAGPKTQRGMPPFHQGGSHRGQGGTQPCLHRPRRQTHDPPEERGRPHYPGLHPGAAGAQLLPCRGRAL